MTESDQQGSERVDVDRQTEHGPANRELVGDQRKAERRAGIALAVAIVAGVGLFVVYFSGGQTQVEGILFGIALGALGVALGIWANHLLDAREVVEERHELTSGPAGRQAFGDALAEEVGPAIGRRSMLLKLLIGAGGALGLALLLPVLSLGPAPGDTLKVTPWQRGKRVVDEEGEPVELNQVPEDGFLTVFPEGFAGASDAQALLIHVRPGSLKLPPERLAWVPEGTHVCYSKICTHAGCPVGLYRAESQSLICPCHQSQFDVADGAKPFFGPAARPLPQLPLGVDDEGILVAQGDFSEPVGPAFWDMNRGS
ncbi:MAG TPA: Rieske 2Fe-2S domain-containing protein [Actinomycetota bacterium]|nr:Rieske 2Fe-2S domain-containing protein [Actinomycetota bacterium]